MISITKLHSDGVVELADQETSWRSVIEPGVDVSGLPEDVRLAIEAHWSEDIGDGKTRAEAWFEANAEEEETIDLAKYAAYRRWEKEVGGIIWNGWPVHTDRESQSKITAAMLAVNMGIRSDTDGWKFADGEFRTLSNEDFSALAVAVFSHVSECFAKEAEVLADITSGVITTQEQIDHVFSDIQ